MNKTLRILPYSPYQLDLRFAFDQTLKDLVKQWPGSHYDAPEEGEIGPRRWIVPLEFHGHVVSAAKLQGFDVDDKVPQHSSALDFNVAALTAQTTFGLHWHQCETIKDSLKGLATTGAWLINLAMRMGKTACAIEVCRLLALQRIAIVCPAMVRGEWKRELQKWWPEGAARVFVWKPGLSKKALEAAQEATIHVVSYGQVQSLPASTPFEIIISDEIHYLQNPQTKQAKALQSLTAASPGALRLGLTGTIVSTHLDSMHAPLSWLWPDRFGTKGSFKYRYLQSEEVYDKRGIKRGLKYGKARSDTAEELRQRLAHCSTRKTKANCPGLFPPLECKLLQPDNVYSEAIALASSILEGGESVAVYAYERKAASQLAKALECPLLSGDEDAATRDLRIESLRQKAAMGPVSFAATISATSTGINLSFCNNFIYTQLSDKIYELIQSFARGHVMGGRSVMIYLMVDEQNRAKAERVQRKIQAVNELITVGIEETQLNAGMNMLKEKGYSDTEWADVCKLMLSESFDDGSTVEDE